MARGESRRGRWRRRHGGAPAVVARRRRRRAPQFGGGVASPPPRSNRRGGRRPWLPPSRSAGGGGGQAANGVERPGRMLSGRGGMERHGSPAVAWAARRRRPRRDFLCSFLFSEACPNCIIVVQADLSLACKNKFWPPPKMPFLVVKNKFSKLESNHSTD